MMNKTICQSILEDLKARQKQDPNLKKVKEDVLNSAMSLHKGREMVFKAFESGIFLKPKQSKQINQVIQTFHYLHQKRNRS